MAHGLEIGITWPSSYVQCAEDFEAKIRESLTTGSRYSAIREVVAGELHYHAVFYFPEDECYLHLPRLLSLKCGKGDSFVWSLDEIAAEVRRLSTAMADRTADISVFGEPWPCKIHAGGLNVESD